MLKSLHRPNLIFVVRGISSPHKLSYTFVTFYAFTQWVVLSHLVSFFALYVVKLDKIKAKNECTFIVPDQASRTSPDLAPRFRHMTIREHHLVFILVSYVTMKSCTVLAYTSTFDAIASISGSFADAFRSSTQSHRISMQMTSKFLIIHWHKRL